jgi:hypothetical protein
LSVEGERYFSVCRQSLDEIDRVEVERAATRTDPGGSVRIRVPPLFGILVIAPALFALADAHSVLPFDMTLKGETVNFLAQRGSGRQDWQSSRCVRIDRTPARPPDDHTLRILQLSRPASNARSISDLAAHRLVATSGEEGVAPGPSPDLMVRSRRGRPLPGCCLTAVRSPFRRLRPIAVSACSHNG